MYDVPPSPSTTTEHATPVSTSSTNQVSIVWRDCHAPDDEDMDGNAEIAAAEKEDAAEIARLVPSIEVTLPHQDRRSRLQLDCTARRVAAQERFVGR